MDFGVGFGMMFHPEHVWLGSVPFCIKQSAFCFTLVCCVVCEIGLVLALVT